MATLHLDDTIAAIASPIGEGGVSVIRVSGPKAFEMVSSIFKSKKKIENLKDCESHTIHLGEVHAQDETLLDQVLVSLFKAPHSYTGEHVIEISSHGGLVVTRKVLNRLIEVGARHAEPGEFTRRAFLNGKIDLTQAEAVLDLIKAKSDLSSEVAVSQLSGNLSARFKALKEELMKLYAHMEAYVDFPEDDLEVYDNQDFVQTMTRIEKELEQWIASFKRGSLIREGLSIVIVGRPNVGKSSLFNTLLERDKAIVSEYEGTTRDTLEESIQVEGVYARLIDTAGLAKQAKDPVDQMGMDRTRQALEGADLFLYVVDGSQALGQEDLEVYQTLPKGKPVLMLANKEDLGSKIEGAEVEVQGFLKLSTLKRTGLEDLESEMAKIFTKLGLQAEGQQVTRERHKNSLEMALRAIQNAKQAFDKREAIECVVEDVRATLEALRELIGEVYSEDLLDVIFSEFCIGK